MIAKVDLKVICVGRQIIDIYTPIFGNVINSKIYLSNNITFAQ